MDIVSSGKILNISGYADATGNVVLSGGVQSSFDFGRVHDTIVSSGGRDEVGGAGFATGTKLRPGGEQIVSSGGRASGTFVGRGAAQSVQAGGVTQGASVSGGFQYVSVGGLAISTMMRAAAGEYAVMQLGGVSISAGIGANAVMEQAGGFDYFTRVSAGGFVEVRYDAESHAATILSGGMMEVGVDTAATAFSTTISQGGAQGLYLGGLSYDVRDAGEQFVEYSNAYRTSVLSGGKQTVVGGGYAANTVVLSGGVQSVTFYDDPGPGPGAGAAEGTIVFGGGSVVVDSGGSIGQATIRPGGGGVVSAGGRASGTNILAGGNEWVRSGGVSDAAVVDGAQTVFTGASAAAALVRGAQSVRGGATTGSVIASGGAEIVSGGVASATTILSGGRESVLSGGIDRGAIVSRGGMQFIASAARVSFTTLLSGATLTVSSGGIVQDGLTLSGGTAHIWGLMGAGQIARFTGGGELELDNLPGFAAQIGGFSAGATIDLGGFVYSPAATRSFAEAPGNTSGTLTISAGAKVANLTLLGSYATGDFALSTDGTGGLFVTYV